MTPKEKNPPPWSRNLALRDRVLSNTQRVRPIVIPELVLNLVTPACALWSATLAQAEAAGLGDPFWAFCWPGGQALARFVLDNPHVVQGRRVLDIGAGSGVCGIAAMLAGAASCTAADTDPMALTAVALNAEANGVPIQTTGADLIGTRGAWDVVLAGDMFYDETITRRVLPWLEGLAQQGITVLAADPDRGFVSANRFIHLATYSVCAEIDTDGTFRVATDVLGLAHRRGWGEKGVHDDQSPLGRAKTLDEVTG